MTNEYRRVKKWMQEFGQETPEKPTQLDEKTAKLRAKLILEEALETITKGLGIRVVMPDSEVDKNNLESFVGGICFFQIGETDLVELADGISDLMVVGEGTCVAAGIDSEPVHEEVCRSNDSKLWTNDEYNYTLCPVGLTFVQVGKDERCWLVKNKDGKVIKSPSYSPANIAAIIEKQKGK